MRGGVGAMGDCEPKPYSARRTTSKAVTPCAGLCQIGFLEKEIGVRLSFTCQIAILPGVSGAFFYASASPP